MFEYNGKCLDRCVNEYYKDINNINKCKCEIDKCLSCNPVAITMKLCNECNDNNYPMENDKLNIGDYINCYKEIKGYYLDKENSIFRKCYYTCETCEIKGDNISHNCLSCNANYSIGINNTNYFNCYKKCQHYYYIDDMNNYICINDTFSPEEYSTVSEDKTEYIKNDLNDIIQNMIDYGKNVTIEEKEEEIKYYDEILDKIESGFISGDFDKSKIDKGEEEVFTTEKMQITLTTTNNQKIKLRNNNMTTINFEKCETLLREQNNISNDTLLYMRKIDVIQEGMKIPKVEYDIYCQFNGTNLVKLNLSICKDIQISLSIPIKITGNKDELNSSSGYYNDICYKATSDKGTDILLTDRKKEYVENDKTVCQEHCYFSEYDPSEEIANCSCLVKESSNSFGDMNINKTQLYENFGNKKSKSLSNLKITSCNVLSSKEDIISNSGFYSLLIIFFIFIIIFIIFCIKGYRLLENKMDEVIYKKF